MMKSPLFVKLLVLAFLLHGSFAFTQANHWDFVANGEATAKALHRPSMPLNYKVLKLDLESLKRDLKEAPLWNTEAASHKPVVIELPMPDGSFQAFAVVNAPVMEDEIARKYPYIQSYMGYSMDDPTAYLRFCINGHGFDGTILSGNHSTVVIAPYEWGKTEYYVVNHLKDFREAINFKCDTDMSAYYKDGQKKNTSTSNNKTGSCQLRSLTVAIAAAGDYSQARGGTIASVMDAITARLTQVNATFESEVALHLKLVNENDQLIFLDPSSDSYGDSECANGAANSEIINGIIPPSSYHIGHVFSISQGAGGCAGIFPWSCSSDIIKANGASGEDTDINNLNNRAVMLHEMGHQFKASHTHNKCINPNGNDIYENGGPEPGAGTTIMAYPGDCHPGPQSVADLYYHANSLSPIIGTLSQLTSDCGEILTVNSSPQANAGLDLTVPKKTPFFLKAAAPNTGTGNTFCWEQMDYGIDPGNGDPPSMPQSNFKIGPLVRSLPPSGSNTRFIPDLAQLATNSFTGWEVLPSVTRTMNFRLTVRNGHCSANDDMKVTIANCGPLKVLTPIANENWIAGTLATITWEVAGTDTHPVNCKFVDLFLSTDGGLTYPVQLASKTLNDGTHQVTVPTGMNTTTARIMVKAYADAFFDVSDANHIISGPTNDFFIASITPTMQNVCTPYKKDYTIIIDKIGNFNGTVALSLGNIPNGYTPTFTPSSINTFPATVKLTVQNTSNPISGIFDLVVNATSGLSTKTRIVQLNVSAGLPSPATPVFPPNGATNITSIPTFVWSAAGGLSYRLQVATSSSFLTSTIVIDAPDLLFPTFRVPAGLDPATTFYWRVGVTNNCGTVNWTNTPYAPFYFTTTSDVICKSITNDHVVFFTRGPRSTEIVVPITQGGTITDVNVNDLNVDIGIVGDLIVKLQSPNGTQITLFNQSNCTEENLLVNFDDEAGSSTLPCPPNDNGTYTPFEPLSTFDGQFSKGTWSLIVIDPIANGGGNSYLKNWTLEFCYEPNMEEEDPGGGDEPGLGGNEGDGTKIQGFTSGNQQGTVETNGAGGLRPASNNDWLNVFPNPSNGQFKLHFFQTNPTADLWVFDALGRELLHQSNTCEEASWQETSLDTSSLPDGTYHLQLRDGQRIISRMVTLLHH